MAPDGVFLSNGPGDPEPCGYAIEAISKIVESSLPVFGICLGHQLLALASGCKNREDEIRAPWRQPPGTGSEKRECDDQQSESWLCCR